MWRQRISKLSTKLEDWRFKFLTGKIWFLSVINWEDRSWWYLPLRCYHFIFKSKLSPPAQKEDNPYKTSSIYFNEISLVYLQLCVYCNLFIDYLYITMPCSFLYRTMLHIYKRIPFSFTWIMLIESVQYAILILIACCSRSFRPIPFSNRDKTL